MSWPYSANPSAAPSVRMQICPNALRKRCDQDGIAPERSQSDMRLGGRLFGQRLALVHGRRNALVRLLGLLMLLVVGRLGVDRPQVMLRTGHDVLDRAHGGEHRVVGVVVAVQAVAADLLDVRDPR